MSLRFDSTKKIVHILNPISQTQFPGLIDNQDQPRRTTGDKNLQTCYKITHLNGEKYPSKQASSTAVER